MKLRRWAKRMVAVGSVLACSLPGWPPPAAAAKAHPPAPRFTIPVEPLGYRPPGHLYMLARHSTSTLIYLDANHLLFTFREAQLLRRDEHAAGDDQLIRALVLELPGGKVSASAEWRLHDRRPFLWRLAKDKALLRVGNELFITDASLRLHSFLRSPMRIRDVYISPDGLTLALQHEVERHSPEEHARLHERALLRGEEDADEDVQVRIVRMDEGKLKLTAGVEGGGRLTANGSGFLGESETRPDLWAVRFRSYEKPTAEGTILDQTASSCPPEGNFINESTVLLLVCSSHTSNRVGKALRVDGKTLWTGQWQSNFMWPTFGTAEGGSSFAIAWINGSHPVDISDPLNDSEVQGQVVDVLDTATGLLRISLPVLPVISAGGNYSLSADGNRLAVLNRGNLEIYDVPPAPAQLPGADEPRRK